MSADGLARCQLQLNELFDAVDRVKRLDDKVIVLDSYVEGVYKTYAIVVTPIESSPIASRESLSCNLGTPMACLHMPMMVCVVSSPAAKASSCAGPGLRGDGSASRFMLPLGVHGRFLEFANGRAA